MGHALAKNAWPIFLCGGFMCNHIMEKGKHAGEQCAKKTGHKRYHQSAQALKNDDRAKRAWDKAHSENSAARGDAWRKANPEQVRNSHREHHWREQGIIGMTNARYKVIFFAQGGVCKICASPPIDKALDVDHDHAVTDRDNVRGLLCNPCNRKLVDVDNGTREPTPDEQRYLAAWSRESLALAA